MAVILRLYDKFYTNPRHYFRLTITDLNLQPYKETIYKTTPNTPLGDGGK